jgi:hypothetical protein
MNPWMVSTILLAIGFLGLLFLKDKKSNKKSPQELIRSGRYEE